jgi:hypothetical protein
MLGAVGGSVSVIAWSGIVLLPMRDDGSIASIFRVSTPFTELKHSVAARFQSEINGCDSGNLVRFPESAGRARTLA